VANAASSDIVSLVKGGSAMHRMGKQFSPDLHTGTGNFTILVVFPFGRKPIRCADYKDGETLKFLVSVSFEYEGRIDTEGVDLDSFSEYRLGFESPHAKAVRQYYHSYPCRYRPRRP
jgi:hypothetical protein